MNPLTQPQTLGAAPDNLSLIPGTEDIAVCGAFPPAP